MKKIFEFLLILIIFYGVFAALDRVLPFIGYDQPTHMVAIYALVAATILLAIYGFLIKQAIKKKMKERIGSLKGELKESKKHIAQKNIEIKEAQSFKNSLIKEAEEAVEE